MMKYANPAGEIWRNENLMSPETIPFSFTYRDKRYHGFSTEQFELIETQVGGDDKKQTLAWTLMAEDGLKITVDTAYYFAKFMKSYIK